MVPKYLQPEFKVKLDSPNFMPTRAYSDDAGADLQARVTTWLPSFKRTLVPTGVRVEIPTGHVGLLVARSSLSKKEIILSNSVGIIDSSYRGELLVALTYIGSCEFGHTISANERIAQLLIVPIILPRFIAVNSLDSTERGEGSFGSTGG